MVRFPCVSGKSFGISAPNCLVGLDREETLAPPGRPSLARNPDSFFFFFLFLRLWLRISTWQLVVPFPTARAVGPMRKDGASWPPTSARHAAEAREDG